MDDLAGKQMGQYRIVAPLGEGGMAAVYRAYQPRIERYVAIKVLPGQNAPDPTCVGRFEQEARVIADLEHPNILPVHDYGEAGGHTYLVMRYVQGGTLAHLMQEGPCLKRTSSTSSLRCPRLLTARTSAEWSIETLSRATS